MLALQIHISDSDQYQAEPVALQPKMINKIMQAYAVFQAQSHMIPERAQITVHKKVQAKIKFYGKKSRDY